MRNRVLIKCTVIAITTASALGLFAFSVPSNSKAESDVIVAEIAKYKTWKKVNERPVEAPSMPATQNTDSNKEPAFTVAGQGG